MKELNVVAAIIQKNDTVLATERGYGDFRGKWEFPGGKIEAYETPEEALIREIKEELNVIISIDSFLTTVNYNYPDFYLTMHCYLCSIKSGKITFFEHSSAKWLHKKNLNSVDWLPADVIVIDSLKKLM